MRVNLSYKTIARLNDLPPIPMRKSEILNPMSIIRRNHWLDEWLMTNYKLSIAVCPKDSNKGAKMSYQISTFINNSHLFLEETVMTMEHLQFMIENYKVVRKSHYRYDGHDSAIIAGYDFAIEMIWKEQRKQIKLLAKVCNKLTTS